MLKLTRPLIWLDVETHSKVPPDKAYICELGFEMHFPDASLKQWCKFIKPPVLISEGAIEVHGITNDKVIDEKPFSYYAKNLAFGFKDCDYGGYNVTFDLKCIATEMKRAGVPWSYEGAYLFDPLRIWQVKKPRTLTDAVQEYLQRKPRDAHRALGDAQDARDVGMAMLKVFPDMPDTLQGLHELCFTAQSGSLDPDNKIVWDGKTACIGFGKWQGIPLSKVDQGYLKWMIGADFSETVKRIVSNALVGQYPVRDK